MAPYVKELCRAEVLLYEGCSKRVQTFRSAKKLMNGFQPNFTNTYVSFLEYVDVLNL